MARRPHADLIHAWAEGAEIEYKGKRDTLWCSTSAPQWDSLAFDFRIKETANKQSTEGLRDYFAAAALTGMYAGYQGNAPEPEQVASDAYFIADEMLKEREK